eukprot:4438447-Pyramimonas_sp.AAC.1
MLLDGASSTSVVATRGRELILVPTLARDHGITCGLYHRLRSARTRTMCSRAYTDIGFEDVYAA